jgi:hypothetical protein
MRYAAAGLAMDAAHVWRKARAHALRWYCRSVAQHWRRDGIEQTEWGCRCVICGARFGALAHAGIVEPGEHVHPRTARRLARESDMRDLRHGGRAEGEPWERVRPAQKKSLDKRMTAE